MIAPCHREALKDISLVTLAVQAVPYALGSLVSDSCRKDLSLPSKKNVDANYIVGITAGLGALGLQAAAYTFSVQHDHYWPLALPVFTNVLSALAGFLDNSASDLESKVNRNV
jgi:hypothetical protein